MSSLHGRGGFEPVPLECTFSSSAIEEGSVASAGVALCPKALQFPAP